MCRATPIGWNLEVDKLGKLVKLSDEINCGTFHCDSANKKCNFYQVSQVCVWNCFHRKQKSSITQHCITQNAVTGLQKLHIRKFKIAAADILKIENRL